MRTSVRPHVFLGLLFLSTSLLRLVPAAAQDGYRQVYYVREDGTLVTSNGPQFRVAITQELAGATVVGDHLVVGLPPADVQEDAMTPFAALAATPQYNFQADGVAIASNSPLFETGASAVEGSGTAEETESATSVEDPAGRTAYARVVVRRDAFRGSGSGSAGDGQAPSSGYTELGSGLGYLDNAGNWRDSIVEPEILADGSVRFSKLPVVRTFTPGSGQRVVVASQRRGGSVAKSALGGLSYYDLSSGRSALIAWVTNVPVQIHAEGVFYERAFIGVDADIVYKVHPWGLEQDVVVYGGLPNPAALGMDPESTRLCVLTELVDLNLGLAGVNRDGVARPADPAVAPIEVLTSESNGWTRIYNWRPSYAYPEEGTVTLGGLSRSSGRNPVASRLFEYGGRVFLSEESSLSKVAAAAPAIMASQARPDVRVVSIGEACPLAVPPVRPVEVVAHTSPIAPQEPPLALHRYQARGPMRYVLDYVDLSDWVTDDITLGSGQTYFISSVLYLAGSTLTIEPGAIVKVAPGSAWIELSADAHLICKSHAANPAIFTSAYDTNVGEVVWSGASPSANKGGNAISCDGGSNTVQGLSIRYMQWGLWFEASGTHFAKDVEIRDCDEGVTFNDGTGTGTVLNVLIRDTPLAVRAGISKLTLEDVTFHGNTDSSVYGQGSLNNLTVRDSAFYSVANAFASNVAATCSFAGNAAYGVTTGWMGSTVVTLASNVFQVGTCGSNYLNQSSAAVNGGVTGAVAVGLYHFTTATNGVKETNSTVDIGYHYPSSADADGDGLPDFLEDRSGDGTYSSNSADISDWNDSDSDDDGLSDGAEYLTYGTNPKSSDTDGDGQSDAQEVNNGSDPLNAGSFLASIAGTISYPGAQTGTIRVVATAEPGLLVYYSFDSNSASTVTDLSGNGNNATAYNGVQWVSNGVLNGAYHYDGTNDWIGGINLGLMPTGSVSMWLKADAVDQWRHPFSTDYASWDDNIHFNMGPPGWFEAAGLGITSSITMASSFTSNVWYHAVMTWTRTNFQAYLNGAWTGRRGHSGVYPPGLNLHVPNLSIGNSYSTAATRYWRGYIDEFKLYTKELTAAEVSNLYSFGVASTIAYTTSIASAGSYVITNVPNLRRYSVTAFVDADGNCAPDTDEASGAYSNNPFSVAGDTTSVDVTLADVDTDGDGMPNWWETKYGLNPMSGAMSNLVAWWKLDETSGTNALDSTTNHNDGWGVNIGASAWTTGQLGGALWFNGSNGYVQVQDSESLKPAQVSVAAWICPSRTLSTGSVTIVSKENPGSAGGYNLRYVNGALDFLVCSGGYYPWYYSLTYPMTLESGHWYHVAGTYDATNHSLYVDGVMVTNVARSVPLSHTTIPPRLGATCDATPICFFPGIIDDARIWDRGLTSNEIAGLREPFADADGDGLANCDELAHGTDPSSADTDADGMPDGWEVLHGLNPLDLSDADGDPDNDGLSNLEEYGHATDPFNFDSDGDLLSDGAEVHRYGTDPTRWSTPGTGTADWEYKLLAGYTTNYDLTMCSWVPGSCDSITICGTTPGQAYDFFLYYYDANYTVHFVVADVGVVATGTNLTWIDCGGPGRLSPGDDPVGLRFYYAGLADDPDGDGLDSIYECFVLGTSPNNSDTNTNGVPDGEEDLDGDGRSNGAECDSPAFWYYNPCIQGSSDPWTVDSDGDGVSDGPIGNGTTIGNGPDAFPLDPYGYRDVDCDGHPDGVNTNFTSNSDPPLQLDTDDEPVGAFCVWAPNASSATVRGDFNAWGESTLTNGGNGYWYGVAANARTGDQYKFYISNALWKQDPASRQVKSADDNSVVRGTNAFSWTDAAFAPPARNQLVIYQLHIGGFNRVGGSGGTFKTATNMLDYVASLGVNAVELMPISEFNGSSSWGYNPVNPYAIERDYGEPDDLKVFVNACHEKGLAVLLDVVYNHWDNRADSGGLVQYDGWTNSSNPGGIYFYEDPSQDRWLYATQWGPRPNYRRAEIRRYIRNNAMVWLHDYHVDGLRWDATHMIRNYDRDFSDNPNMDIPEGWTMLQQANDDLRAYRTNYVAIAEDLLVNTNSRKVTVTTALNGLGFDARWSPFVHQIRDNIANSDPWVAKMKEELEFSYNSDPFDRVTYVESHDEVGALNQKKRFAQQIAEFENPGSPDPTSVTVQKRAILGAALTFTAPGIPMFFMGQEFLQAGSWTETNALSWGNTNSLTGVVHMHQDLIALRKNVAGNTAGLQGAGLHVNSPVDDGNNILAFYRYDRKGPGDDVMVIANLSGTIWTQSNYEIGFPTSGVWKVRFSSDWKAYNSGFGGIPTSDQLTVSAASQPMHGHPFRAAVNMGAYGVMVLSQDVP